MSDLTKAEQHFFHPESLVALGILERCANCPILNHDVSQHLIHRAFVGEIDTATTTGRYLAQLDAEKEAGFRDMSANCPGHEELSSGEIDEYINQFRDVDRLDRESIVTGYRCRATGEAVVAITYGNGWVGLKPWESGQAPSPAELV